MAPDLCLVCSKQGIRSRLCKYQLNLDEAVYLCKKYDCPYPLESLQVSTFVTRSKAADNLVCSKKRKRQEIPGSVKCDLLATSEESKTQICYQENIKIQRT